MENSKRIETLEKKFESIQETNKKKLNAERNDKFKDLEEKFENLQEEFRKKTNELENTLKQETKKGDALREYVKKLERENETIQCEHCDFTTTSKKGFKTHVKKKHLEVCALEINSKV